MTCGTNLGYKVGTLRRLKWSIQGLTPCRDRMVKIQWLVIHDSISKECMVNEVWPSMMLPAHALIVRLYWVKGRH